MTLIVTYPLSGESRTFTNLTQREVNRSINYISSLKEKTPLVEVKCVVTD